jgi:hypothetical protein
VQQKKPACFASALLIISRGFGNSKDLFTFQEEFPDHKSFWLFWAQTINNRTSADAIGTLVPENAIQGR